MKRLIANTISYIVVLLALLVLAVWGFVIGSGPVSKDTTPVRVTIAKGSSAQKIAEILYDHQLIRSRFIFALTCRLGGAGDKLKPGVYEFSKAMGTPRIIGLLQQGQSLEVWVTIPEGFTAAEIAGVLQEKQLADGQAFVRMAIDEGHHFPSYPSIESSNLEGYLFPDTYLISRGSDTEAIIKKMLDAFERKVVDAHRTEIQQAISRRFSMMREEQFADGLHKLLTVASLVEREAKIDKDRRLIAAVIWNRLDRGMKLQVDATASYEPGKSTRNKERTFYKDLEVDSPYNTYKYPGLPPAPICNPGLASILAALDPAPVDYLFYVARKDGSHVFSRTYAEHLSAIKRVRGEG